MGSDLDSLVCASATYVLTSAAIVRNRKIYHKTKSKTLSNDNFQESNSAP